MIQRPCARKRTANLVHPAFEAAPAHRAALRFAVPLAFHVIAVSEAVIAAFAAEALTPSFKLEPLAAFRAYAANFGIEGGFQFAHVVSAPMAALPVNLCFHGAISKGR